MHYSWTLIAKARELCFYLAEERLYFLSNLGELALNMSIEQVL